MRPSTRMMMISALGEDRNRMDGGQMYDRRMEQDNQMRRGEMYAEQEREMRRDEMPTQRRYARRYARQEMMPPESRYEAHWDEDEDMGRESRRRRMQHNMGGYESTEREEYERPHSRGMYSAQDNPMGFSSHKRRDEDEEELSGSFRYRAAPRDVQKDHQESEGLSEPRVKKWLKEMKNEDGTTGAHFGRDSAETIRRAHCPKCDELEFYAAINMIYSDYCKVAKDLSVDRPEFYAYMAKAFLEDKDAGEDKLLKYMRYIAEK